MKESIISIPGFADPVSCWTHLISAAVALVMGFKLIVTFKGRKTYRTGLVIFVFSTVFMLSMSGVYHLLGPGGTPRYVLQHLDHAGIWLMIAGSFTPIHLMLFKGWRRWGVLAVIWVSAINGIVLKTVFFDEFPEWLGLTLYLCLGWVGVLSAFMLTKRYGLHAVRYLIYGGLSYTVGAVIEFMELPHVISGVIGPHELFHFGVIGGVIYHWHFIQDAIALSKAESAGGPPPEERTDPMKEAFVEPDSAP